MKKLIYCAAALATMIFAGSCQQENLEPVAGDSTVTFTVELPGPATKAKIGDGENVNQLVYEVWMIGKDKTEIGENDTRLFHKDIVNPNGNSWVVNLNLVKDQTYKVLFWAQVNGTGVYNTEKLTEVHYGESVSEAYLANQESYAAFYGSKVLSTYTPPKGETITLYRPFAQLNIGTTNDAKADEYTINLKKSSVVVKNVPTVFNVSNSEATEAEEFTFNLAEVPAETLYVGTDSYNYVAMNYMFAGSRTNITVDYTIETEVVPTAVGATATKAEINNTVINVPIQENYRTNIVGNLLTSSVQYEVVIDDVWAGADLAPDPIYLAAAIGGDVTLTEDVVLTEPLNINADMSLDLNGKTITGTLNVAAGVDFVLENGKVVNTDRTVSGVTSNGSLTLNNVEIESARHAVRVESGSAVINGGTYKVVPVSSSTLYALNVGDGPEYVANVTINGGTFIGPKGTMADSGGAVTVKVGSTVKINGGDFSGGKSKTVSVDGTLTVIGGSFDQDPTAYVAEGYKVVSYDDEYVVVSADVDAVVASNTELATVLNAAAAAGTTTVVVDAAGNELNLNYGFNTTKVPAGTTVTIRNADVKGQSKKQLCKWCLDI